MYGALFYTILDSIQYAQYYDRMKTRVRIKILKLYQLNFVHEKDIINLGRKQISVKGEKA